MENTLSRSSPCAECGAELLWTQNAWNSGETALAAYRCGNGHVLDPSTTRQCPACGIHDTVLLSEVDGQQQFRCARCGEAFQFPR
jgi:DNA-directed RNA polymerase subunit RPC12/RpoP